MFIQPDTDPVMNNSEPNNEDMWVTKRTGKLEKMKFDKIMNRIKKSGEQVNIHVNYTALTIKIIDQLYDKIPTTKIDELTAEQCYSMASIHPDYAVLASRIIHSNHHRNTVDSFYAVMTQLYKFVDKHGKPAPMISETTYGVVKKYRKELDAMVVVERDFLIDYFGFKTLERAYLMRIYRKVVERIQHMWLRVSIGIHGDNLDRVKETYDLMSQKYCIHATPTLFNAGTPRPQLSSCYLLSMEEDSIDGIFNTLQDCAKISKWGGGIGLHVHNVRATGSHIRGTNGQSNGLVPMLRVFNNTAKYVDQCFTPDTVVFTEAGPRRIEDVGITDRVLTSTGKFHAVKLPVRHDYDGPMLEFFVKRVNAFDSVHLNAFDSVRVTPEHQVMVLRNDDPDSNDVQTCLQPPEFVDAKELQVGDWVVYPIPEDTHQKDVEHLSLDDCHLYGILVGSAHISDDSVVITLNHEGQESVVEFVYNYCLKRGISVSEHTQVYNRLEIRTILRWSVVNPGFKFLKAQFYDASTQEKRVDPAFLHLPLLKVNEVVRGILDSSSNDIMSSHVRDSLDYMQLRLSSLCDGKYVYSRIDRIEETTYRGIVHDFEIDGPHDYTVAHLGIAHNGGGKRNGSFAIYLEPWHADVQSFLQMKKNHGDEETKARDLFYAMWIPDLFMERMHRNGPWTLMCPDECPGLSDVWGDDFVALYERYEREGRGRETVQARDLWIQMLDAQMETGTPYLLYKDACNRKSNQKNLGTIKSSNLCTEIVEYSDGQETAVCNLASIALPSFLVPSPVGGTRDVTMDWAKLHEVAKVLTYNLNVVIDVNYYPTEKTALSNKKHRPVGIGVQGLADVFMMLQVPFESAEAKELNRRIFATIYHGALEQSCELAERDGPYASYAGSPASQGQLQYDLWSVTPVSEGGSMTLQEGSMTLQEGSMTLQGGFVLDWTALKARIAQHGLRNSLLLAPMPTASTSQILGFNECFEPITSNIYSRGTSAGQFLLANKYLQKDLLQRGLWNEQVKNNIVANNGSVQQIEVLPQSVRDLYKTVWEIPMKTLIDMAVDRGAYICQSQSLNLWLEDPTYKSLTSMHYYSWKQGLKTGIYYLRRRAKHQAQKFTIEPEKAQYGGAAAVDEEYVCEMCSA